MRRVTAPNNQFFKFGLIASVWTQCPILSLTNYLTLFGGTIRNWRLRVFLIFALAHTLFTQGLLVATKEISPATYGGYSYDL